MSFKSVQKKIAGQGHSMSSAGAILANASRHASPAAKRANPNLSKVKGKLHSGGTVPEDGLYQMQAGEHVSPATHNDDSYISGSEGSRLCRSNIKKYNMPDNRSEASPAETDHPYTTTPSAYHYATDSEQIRRENNRLRDRRKRWSVLTSPIATDTNSDAEKNAEAISGRKD